MPENCQWGAYPNLFLCQEPMQVVYAGGGLIVVGDDGVAFLQASALGRAFGLDLNYEYTTGLLVSSVGLLTRDARTAILTTILD